MNQPLKLLAKVRIRSAMRMKWLKSTLRLPEPESFAQAGFGSLPSDYGETTRIRDFLDRLQRDPRGRVKLTYARSPVVIEGRFEASAMVELWPLLVGAFVQAAEGGAVGEVSLTNDQRVGMRVRLAADSAPVLERYDPRSERAQKKGPVRLPGILENASTGRSSCRACRQQIAGGTVRFGVLDLRKGLSERPTYRWFHPSCAAKVVPESLGPVLRDSELVFAQRDSLWQGLPEAAQKAPKINAFPKGTRVRDADGRAGVVVWFGIGKYEGRVRAGVLFDSSDEPTWMSPEDLVRA